MHRFLRHDEPALIWTGELVLDGRLTVPHAAPGLILMPGLGGTFHHNGIRALAARFHDNGFATLIADLLTPDEQQVDARTHHFRSDLERLSQRLDVVSDWLRREQTTRDLPLAFFGSGLIASAALFGAANGTTDYFAVTIVHPRLGAVRDLVGALKTPALLIVDETAPAPASVLAGELRIDRIAAVTPLLENVEAREEVAQKALVWMRNHVPVLAA